MREIYDVPFLFLRCSILSLLISVPKCDVGEMICPSSGMCAKYCNNVPECEGGEDEIFCTECPGIPASV